MRRENENHHQLEALSQRLTTNSCTHRQRKATRKKEKKLYLSSINWRFKLEDRYKPQCRSHMLSHSLAAFLPFMPHHSLSLSLRLHCVHFIVSVKEQATFIAIAIALEHSNKNGLNIKQLQNRNFIQGPRETSWTKKKTRTEPSTTKFTFECV